MPRNHLKTFPTAILRRGMVHFRPAAGAAGRNLATRERARPTSEPGSSAPIQPGGGVSRPPLPAADAES